MKYIADLISDITSNFYGGVSHNINYNDLVKKTFDEVSHKANSSTLLSVSKLYHGLIRDSHSLIIPNTTNKIVEVDYNGIKYKRSPLTARSEYGYSFSIIENIADFTELNLSPIKSYIYTVLDEFTDVNGFTSDLETATLEKPVTYRLNKNGGIKVTFDSQKQKIKKTLSTPITQESIKDNVLVMPIYISDITKDVLDNTIYVKLVDNGIKNLIATIDLNSQEVQNGWNIFEFDLANLDFDIYGFEIYSDLINDQKLDLVFERAILTRQSVDYVKYYSNKFVRDKDTYKMLYKPVHNSDALYLDNKFYQAMIYEGAIILGFEVTDRVKHRYDIAYFNDKLSSIYNEIGDTNLMSEDYDYKDDLIS